MSKTETGLTKTLSSRSYNDLFLEFDYRLADTTRPQYHRRLSEFFEFMGLNGDETQKATSFLEQVRTRERF